MHRTLLAALPLLCAACATPPARQPVAPEPPLVLQTGECADLGFVDSSVPGPKFDPMPYGWVQLRVDVERGAVVNAEVLDASPKKLFEAQTIAYVKTVRFVSQGSARGCVWNHKWG